MKIVNRTGVLSATLINAESNAYQWMSKTVAVDTEKITNLCYGVTMMNKENNNPYAAYILSKARDLPTAQPCTKQVPARFVNRFSTYKEYEEAMADFLNGM